VGADIFGIGREIHRRFPKEWKRIKADWDDIYRDLEVQIMVENKIVITGLVERPSF
jgi:spore germination protein KC